MIEVRENPVDIRPTREVASIWRLTPKRVDPLAVLNLGTHDPHVYCVHPMTGDVIGLRCFADHFGDRRLHAIQVPKDQMNEAFAASIESLATRYVDLVTRRQPEGPIHLVGWSAGAIIALEMARRFEAIGRSVPLLAALDGAPCNRGARWKAWDRRYLLALAGDQKAFIHAMYKAMVDYVPKPYDGRVVVYETRTQPLVHLRQIGAARKAIAPRTEIVPVDGNHTGMVTDPAIGNDRQRFPQ